MATASSSHPTSTPQAGAAGAASGQDLSQPGPEHAALRALAGTWTVSFSHQMGGQTMTGSGTSVFSLLFNGRYLREDFTGEFAGHPFTGQGLRGFDRRAQRYVSTWIDGMSTGLAYTTGTASADGREIRLTGTTQCPQSQAPTTLIQVYRFVSDDRFTLTMANQREGQPEQVSMDMVYQRRR